VLKSIDARKSRLKKSTPLRSARGAGIIGVSLIVGLIILPTLAIFSFEMSRMFLAKQQLQNATDAAVLAATAQLASSNNSSPTTAHTNAMAAALTIFQQNSVLGGQLSTSSIVANASDLTPAPGEALIYFQFIDPVTKLPVPISSPNGKIINLQSAYCAYLAFGNYLGYLSSMGKYFGLNNFTVDAISKGAVPILDVEICFDVSGSMDDETNVTFVRRTWDASLGKLQYTRPNAPTSTGKAEGTIFNILQPAPIGTSLNGNFPQLYDQSDYSNYGNPLEFTWDTGTTAHPDNLRSLGGYPDAGQPPGNYPPGPPDNGLGDYTDVVVNLDGNAHFGGITIGAYSFPDLPTLVEAARGNLENNGVFNSSKANTTVSVTPKAGYQAAYLNAMVPLLQPIANSQAATLLFANILNTDTDCHFALIAFGEVIGTSGSPNIVIVGGNSYENVWNIDQGNLQGTVGPYGAAVNYPMPLIPLNPALAQTNYGTVTSAIQSTVALGGTNISAAINQAVTDLQANGRQGSVKAIILFTDGEPTDPTDPATGAALARAAAVNASNAGYPVYTIGLAQIPQIEPSEIAILNDTNPNPTTGGIAAISGHGATFDLVTDSSQLSLTFEKIARRLVELVATNSGDY